MNHTPKVNLSQSENNTLGFLRAILPSTGYYCIAIKSPHGMRQQFFTSLEDAAGFAQLASSRGLETYHACASYRDGSNRKAENVQGTRAFWLDVDVGPNKPYADDRTALAAVLAFCNAAGLPTPMVVHSGGGWHCYWCLTEIIPAEVWKAYALALKTLCAKHGLQADPSRTADIASILRPVGTFNYKRDIPAPIVLRHSSGPHDLADFVGALTPARSNDNSKFEVRTSGIKQPSHGAIIVASCGQLSHFRASQGRLPEPEWYAGLCVLASCEDGHELAHAWSKGDERYSFEDTEQKLSHAKRDSGPTTCAHFQSINPAPCIDCPHNGKITSPIQLGRKLTATTALPPDVAAVVEELAKLSPVDYDRAREAAAKDLGIRIGTLDEQVARRRPATHEDADGRQGRALSLPSPEPWPEPVEGMALLEALAAAIARHVALPDGAAEAIALWIIHAHALEASPISPRLTFISPEPRCGKTTALRFVARVVPKALMTANISPAAVFRTIEAVRPCLLIDEADSFTPDNDELRGIVNSGHASDGCVIRLVGDDHMPRAFSTWCPTVFASIGKLPATIMDRSIIIPMRRRRADEPVQRLRGDRRAAFEDLGRKAARWAADNLASLKDADPVIPEALDDRASDNWRPLLAVADLARGDWPAHARQAALVLSSASAGEEPSVRAQVLADIREQFVSRSVDRMASGELCQGLIMLTDRPWGDWDHGRALTQRQLAKLLAPFGIRPINVRTPVVAKGYTLEQFKDAFERYL